jgi:nucleotide-binding universal stress UspA family protein
MRALQARSKILVPVNGTEVSRRAVEIALVIARPNDARVTTLYVPSGTQNSDRRRPRRGSATHRNEEAVLKEVTDLADRYGSKVRTQMRVDFPADDAILKEGQRGKCDLIILGVTRRPGETLHFGNTAAAVLERHLRDQTCRYCSWQASLGCVDLTCGSGCSSNWKPRFAGGFVKPKIPRCGSRTSGTGLPCVASGPHGTWSLRIGIAGPLLSPYVFTSQLHDERHG